jgi:uncharacterized protein YndB with AHSA1/START domain
MHQYASIQGNGAVRRIALANELNAPLDTVWRAITNVDQIQHWWPDWRPGGIIEQSEGGIVRLGDGSWIDGIVKVWRPPHIFEFTWHETIEGDPEWLETYTNSLLRIDLVQLAGSKTLLNLIQFAPETSVVGGTAGWHYFAGERLASFLREGEVIDDPERFSQLKQLYETS